MENIAGIQFTINDEPDWLYNIEFVSNDDCFEFQKAYLNSIIKDTSQPHFVRKIAESDLIKSYNRELLLTPENINESYFSEISLSIRKRVINVFL